MALTGNVGQQLTDKAFIARSINEAGSVVNTIRVRGIAPLSSGDYYVKIGDTEFNVAAGADGLLLVLLDGNFNMTFNAVYDVSNSAQRTNFINKINSSSNQIWCVASAGAFTSATDLDNFWLTKGSTEWKGSNMYNQYDYSFAAIGHSSYGVLREVSWFDNPSDPEQDGASVLYTLDDFTDIGLNGYQLPIIELTSLTAGSANAVTAATTFLTNQRLIVSVLGSTAFDRASVSDYDEVTVQCLASNDAVLKTDTISIRSCELLNNFTKEILPPSNTAKIKIWHAQASATINAIIAYKSATKAKTTGTPKFSKHAVAASNIYAAPGMWAPSDINAFKSYARMSQNLYNTVTLPQDAAITTAILGDEVITATDEITEVDNNQRLSFPSQEIDEHVKYFASVWVYIKGSGTATLVLATQNASSAAINHIREQGTQGSETFVDRTTESGRWVLLSGWILPSQLNATEHTNWANEFKNYFGDFGGTAVNAGVIRSLGTTTKRYQIQVDTSNLSGTIQYAFPMLHKVVTMSHKADGEMSMLTF